MVNTRAAWNAGAQPIGIGERMRSGIGRRPMWGRAGALRRHRSLSPSRPTDRQCTIDRPTHPRCDRRSDHPIVPPAARPTDRQTDGPTGRPTDRQRQADPTPKFGHIWATAGRAEGVSSPKTVQSRPNLAEPHVIEPSPSLVGSSQTVVETHRLGRAPHLSTLGKAWSERARLQSKRSHTWPTERSIAGISSPRLVESNLGLQSRTELEFPERI